MGNKSSIASLAHYPARPKSQVAWPLLIIKYWGVAILLLLNADTYASARKLMTENMGPTLTKVVF